MGKWAGWSAVRRPGARPTCPRLGGAGTRRAGAWMSGVEPHPVPLLSGPRRQLLRFRGVSRSAYSRSRCVHNLVCAGMEALWAEGRTKLPPTLEVGVVRGEGNPKARAKAKCWEPTLGFRLRPGTVTLVLPVLDAPGPGASKLPLPAQGCLTHTTISK